MLLSRAKFQNFYSSCVQSVSWGEGRRDAIERVELLPLAIGVAELCTAPYHQATARARSLAGFFPFGR